VQCSVMLNFPSFLWEYAAICACYLHNITPTSSLPRNSTPLIRWHQDEYVPSSRHHHFFGCTAFYHVPNHQRHKLENRGRAAIFLGYGTMRGGFLLLDVELQELLYSRNVRFC